MNILLQNKKTLTYVTDLSTQTMQHEKAHLFGTGIEALFYCFNRHLKNTQILAEIDLSGGVKFLAFDTTADRNASSQFPAGIPQAAFPGAAVPLNYLMDRPRPLAEAGGWHRGGINE